MENCTAQILVKQCFAYKSAVESSIFQKLDPFWNLWSKLIPRISSKKLYPAPLFCNLERKIGHEIFPIKFRTSEQIFIFWISKMFQISGSPTLK